jgi:cytoskeleton protein RodZ
MFEIGSSLREARLRQHLEFPEVEQAIKIRSKYLRALEEEQFDTLPAPTYVKGFLRGYADFLGLDGQLYVDEYHSRYVTGEEELAQPRARRTTARPRAQRRLERNGMILALAGIAAVTALVIAAWRFGGGETQEAAFRGLSTPTARSTIPALLPQERAKKRPRRVKLELTASRGESWLQVHAGSANGRVLYQGTLERGQTQVFVARRVWMTVGVPEALRAKLNGNRLELPEKGPAAVLVTPKGLRSATA